jgi:hypothetical protein
MLPTQHHSVTSTVGNPRTSFIRFKKMSILLLGAVVTAPEHHWCYSTDQNAKTKQSVRHQDHVNYPAAWVLRDWTSLVGGRLLVKGPHCREHTEAKCNQHGTVVIGHDQRLLPTGLVSVILRALSTWFAHLAAFFTPRPCRLPFLHLAPIPFTWPRLDTTRLNHRRSSPRPQLPTDPQVPHGYVTTIFFSFFFVPLEHHYPPRRDCGDGTLTPTPLIPSEPGPHHTQQDLEHLFSLSNRTSSRPPPARPSAPALHHHPADKLTTHKPHTIHAARHFSALSGSGRKYLSTFVLRASSHARSRGPQRRLRSDR